MDLIPYSIAPVIFVYVRFTSTTFIICKWLLLSGDFPKLEGALKPKSKDVFFD